MDIGIIGGSLGGLTTALLLRDLGHNVHVFERSKEQLHSRGAGIVVHPMTTKYFSERAGISLDKVSTPSEFLRYLNAKGEVIYEEKRSYRFTAWNALYRELIGLFGTDNYHLNHKMTSFEQKDSIVTVNFENGNSETFDLLVCVDGIGSTARKILQPSAALKYGGYVGWRGVASEAEVSKETFEALNEAIVYQVIPNSHIVMYPIPALDGSVTIGNRLLNYVWYRNVEEGEELNKLLTGINGYQNPISLPPGQVKENYISELKEFATSNLAPPLAEVVEKTKEPFLQAMFDLEIEKMVFDRIVLMGDGAFAARPHAAAGTAKAAADGWALAEKLSQYNELSEALSAWEKQQLEVGKNLVERSRNSGIKSQFNNNWTPGDPDLYFGLFEAGN